MNPRETHTRLHCQCRHCVKVCKAAPGFLTPVDLERITDAHVPPETSQDCRQLWQIDHFRYSEEEGTIIPRQHEDGRCIFLDDSDECVIHDIAPYGCSHVNRCGDPVEMGERARAGLLSIEEDYDNHGPYAELVDHLASRQAFCAPPLDERNAALGDLQ